MKAFERLEQLNRDFFDSLRDIYVPACGPADTLGGEIIRAMDRVIYRYFNDGDKVFVGYGNETVNSSYRFLYEKMDECADLDGAPDDETYEKCLVTLAEDVKRFLEGLSVWDFCAKNEEDSRVASEEDLEAAREEEYEEEYEEEW